ncbi:hypothetical protein HDV00_008560 [Rhizophlyctis rosea]|nr:hypothetical protein HDV00_008560 [Rhizophlyctis rosea]
MDKRKQKTGSEPNAISRSKKPKYTYGTASRPKVTSHTGVAAAEPYLANPMTVPKPANPYPHLVCLIDMPPMLQKAERNGKPVIAWDFGTRGSTFYLGKTNSDWFELPKTRYHPSERCKEASVVLYDAADATANRLAVGFEAIKRHSSEPDFRTRAVKSFKLHLYDQQGHNWNAVGKSASEVLQEYIQYYLPIIRKRLELEKSLAILTAPAKAESSALHRLRQAAERAGFPSIVILPEQEAALYCILNDAANAAKPFTNGSTIAVIDAGGGTVDIGVYRILRADRPWRVEEIEKSESLVGAGEKMDRGAKAYFRDLVGCAAWQEFKTLAPNEYFEYEHLWDEIKSTYEDGDASITFYPALKAATKNHGTYQAVLRAQDNQNRRLEMPERQIKAVFDAVIDPILARLNNITAKHKLNDVIPVGGMSKMPYFMRKLREKFPDTVNDLEDWPTYKRFNDGWYEKRFFPIVQIGQKVEENFLYQLKESILPQEQGDYGVEVYLLTTTEAFNALNPRMCDRAVRYDVDFKDDWRGEKNMVLALRFHLAELMVLLRSEDGTREERMHPAAVL